VVEPHRFRGATLAVNDAEVGVRAPSLRGFPQLTLPPEAASTAVEDRPRLLGVPFVGSDGTTLVDVDVFVGSTPHGTNPGGQEPLPTDPNSRASEQAQSLNGVVLPPLQPRAYATEDTVTLTYEGSFAGDRTSGFLRDLEAVDAEWADATAPVRLADPSFSFCGAGVYDEASMTAYAENELGLTAEQAAAFAVEHSDYVQLTGPLPEKSSAFWTGDDYARCLQAYGADDADSLSANREFRVLAAFADHLVLTPRRAAPEISVRECFPSANKYRVRAGKHWVLTHAATGFNHDIVAIGTESRCQRTCNPLKKWAKSRAFEISSALGDDDAEPGCRESAADADPLALRVGCAEPGEVACVYDQNAGNGTPRGSAVQPGGPGWECVFDGLTERFAIYRGRAPTQRDTAFTWQTAGGFAPLLMSLANISSSRSVSPQSMQFLPEPELMAVVDGSALGLSLFSLDTFTVVKPSPFY
jgi:hypothetical protein